MKSERYGTVKLYDKQIKQWHSEGTSAGEIGRRLGYRDSKIINRAKILGLSFSARKAPPIGNRLEEKSKQIIEMYNQGISMPKIAAVINDNYTAVRKFLIKKGFIGKNKNIKAWTQYSVDENFFEKIDTAEKAYVLGWWYSDGNVMPQAISLNISDLEILQKIRKILKYTGDFYVRYPKQKNRKIMYTLTIGRQKMVDDIIKLGCIRNKSLILKFPTMEQVPQDLLSHFIRGYFDGDGSIFFNSQQNWGCDLVGTKEFLEGFINLQICNGYFNVHNQSKSGQTWLLKIGKRSEIKKFLVYIYKDATIFLRRKKDLADQFLQSV